MRTATALLNLMLLVAIVGLVGLPGSNAVAQTQDATEDVLYLENGQVLRGQIVSEDRDTVEFEYTDTRVKIKMTRKFRHDEIEKIERDQPSEASSPAVEPEKPRRVRRATSRPDGSYAVDESGRTIGVRRGNENDETLPRFYLVPMKGQMGTDINSEVYTEMIDDIRAAKPDYLVVEMECLDEEERLYSRVEALDKGEHDFGFLDDYRDLAQIFHAELRDIPQTLWIHDSHGVSSVIALSWDSIYIRPEGRLGGLGPAAQNFMRVAGDANMFGKFREAYMGWLKGFVEYGDVDLEVMDAMVRPEMRLSATWKGRQVDWTLNDLGEYVVDNSDKRTANFTAKMAEDFVIADGVADTLSDVALLMGVREYRVIDGEADDIFEDHREGWRNLADKCEEWLQEYVQFMGWASGEDTLKYIGQAKHRLEMVLSAIERYKAVEHRMLKQGVTKFALITQIEILKEQIRAMKQGQRNGRGGGGRSGGGGMGSG